MSLALPKQVLALHCAAVCCALPYRAPRHIRRGRTAFHAYQSAAAREWSVDDLRLGTLPYLPAPAVQCSALPLYPMPSTPTFWPVLAKART
ncbi:hypothetical protein LY76DRAFT_593235, partial [Colletotrichum caudatum]